MAKWVEAFAAKTGNITSISGNHIEEGETTSCLLASTYMSMYACAHTHTVLHNMF